MNRNYQKELDRIIDKLETRPRLLLHSCCAPCSSYCLEYLKKYFDITVFYYNPNISIREEYEMRAAEARRLAGIMNSKGKPVDFVLGRWNSEDFFARVKGYETAPEGGERCRICFEMRLMESALYAKENGYDYYTTTLTISPLKNAAVLNEIGEECGRKCGVEFLPSDFKKREGYKRSIELSKEYGLYRQNYCGCIFSKSAIANKE